MGMDDMSRWSKLHVNVFIYLCVFQLSLRNVEYTGQVGFLPPTLSSRTLARNVATK